MSLWLSIYLAGFIVTFFMALTGIFSDVRPGEGCAALIALFIFALIWPITGAWAVTKFARRKIC